jgi:hypothetical protein
MMRITQDLRLRFCALSPGAGVRTRMSVSDLGLCSFEQVLTNSHPTVPFMITAGHAWRVKPLAGY